MSKFSARLRIFPRGLLQLLKKNWRRAPTAVKRILVAHNLLLGDTVMLTPLLAKLRGNYPQAAIVLLCKPAFVEVYRLNPYGVVPMPYQPASAASVSAIVNSGPYDLALIPGDNRYSWLALAAGSRWIVAHRPAQRNAKSWPVNEYRDYPVDAMAWGDAMAGLTDGELPAPQRWSAPACDFSAPESPFVVLHVGASNPVRFWPPERWLALADWLAAQGYTPVWSGGGNERHIVDAIDPQRRYRSFAGELSLSQLLTLLADAKALICADTGVAHLAKWVNTPTMTLYGPGNPVAFGPGRFWQNNPIINLGFHPIPCRDQHTLFGRELPWLERCNRNDTRCLQFCDGQSACMKQISLPEILTAFTHLLRKI
ncbi:ADP-heptose--LPS heptosyltransferase 2 [Dickeya dianthicola]|uniref:Glycosyltransferase family 9 protein n=2 Tax=Dickeya dianthicola TaxID=204039 RepID=A0AAP6VCJ4_9GAMM|nr:glycosyltransferase family 9 protein [Dickeya dianthicola]ATO35651.1 Heptosyltransferase family protein lipopolysaccharide core biosynthesis [Dickeya dianthicola RNS04.9]AYC17087.1 ADP-heptose--LPS heptosyltransferase 2 [Dickeya dianthicola]MBI0437375.1 glycosyltransferase family 9 protein [Dickeya dianthicola]MBI0449095.1 glycosyltransferase family 9 protein [Dickeya dianthicola]MBI0453213.1 glycosyltransferase family 9 protein [Dickeya dianthicola]